MKFGSKCFVVGKKDAKAKFSIEEINKVFALGSREIVGYTVFRIPDAKLIKQALIHVIKKTGT